MARNPRNPPNHLTNPPAMVEFSAEELVNTSASSVSGAILVNPKGVFRAEITSKDMNGSGTYRIQTAFSSSGPWYEEPIPVMSKVVGANLDCQAMVLEQPAAFMARIAWNATNGTEINSYANIASW